MSNVAREIHGGHSSLAKLSLEGVPASEASRRSAGMSTVVIGVGVFEGCLPGTEIAFIRSACKDDSRNPGGHSNQVSERVVQDVTDIGKSGSLPATEIHLQEDCHDST